MNVRTLRVLPPAPVQTGPATAAAGPAPQPAAPAAPVERRTPPAGYLRALAAHRASRTPTTVDPTIQAAAERQTRQQAREPEELFGDGQAVVEERRERAARQRAADTTRARALRRLADERAGRVSSTPQRLERPA
ncbi:hypothetical protein QT196_38930 (plasmid) [Streptomyces sp. P9-2B-2]|uniref:hypothetical protein n=1 Tax=Streptomyces sp. P9-2B-2 TaxID=3057114 RepID=UPI0025B41718|nr:hypothetical protein [Streptomyces sp. P9-2B-2]WJY43239.1 hypothetical protein QT196_38930 [Streptomyces sp. P9-2B-2]